MLEAVNEEQVHAVEDFFGRASPVVACPAANDRVEGIDESGLGATPVLANDVLDLFEVASLRFPAGFR